MPLYAVANEGNVNATTHTVALISHNLVRSTRRPEQSPPDSFDNAGLPVAILPQQKDMTPIKINSLAGGKALETFNFK